MIRQALSRFIGLPNNASEAFVRDYRTKFLRGKVDMEEGMSHDDCDALRTIVKLSSAHNAVEVGSWKGKSTSIIASTMKRGHLWAVDTWMGSKGAWCESIASHYDVFAIFQQNMRLLHLDKVVIPVREESSSASKRFADKSLDLVFIDADHRYLQFKNDLQDWERKVREGGIIAGHDAERKYSTLSDEERSIVDRSLESEYVGFCHQGVVKALYERYIDDYIIAGKVWYRKIPWG